MSCSTAIPSTPIRSTEADGIKPMHFQNGQFPHNKHINPLPAPNGYVSPSDAIHSPASMKLAAFRHKQLVNGARKQKPLFMRSIQARQQKLADMAAAQKEEQPMFADIQPRC